MITLKATLHCDKHTAAKPRTEPVRCTAKVDIEVRLTQAGTMFDDPVASTELAIVKLPDGWTEQYNGAIVYCPEHS